MTSTSAPADAAVRELALDPSRSFIVEAPAGSGKTTLLTQRFLRLLSIAEQPESIVAITFTRKAAEEMRGRILDALLAAQENPAELDAVTRRWAGAALAASDRNGWRLLDSPRRLRIQTIDSLSATLARRGPIMSGYAGSAEVRENATQLYQQAAHASIAALAEPGVWSDAVQILLRHLDNDWAWLEGLLVEMLARRDQWLRVVIQNPDRSTFENALEAAVQHELENAAAALPQELAGDIVRLASFAGDNLRRDYPDNSGCILAGLTAMPGTNCSDLPMWQGISALFFTDKGDLRKRVTKAQGLPAKGPGAAENKALFEDLARQFAALPGLITALNDLRGAPQPVYSDDQWLIIEALFMVLKLAAAELKISFNRSGAVDFVEVAHAALAALGDAQQPSELGLILDYQIQHLLVDEFQDTSITQYQLIERLLDGWSIGDGRSLFLVGDPMQSIYRFRQADVGLFIGTCTAGRLAAVPLEVLQLTTNFRAQAAVVDWINAAMDQMREDAGCPFKQMPHLVAARTATARKAVEIHGFIATDNVAESDAVLEIVKRTQAETPGASIGILVRGRRHLGAISNVLSAAGIAVSASEIERLAEQTVVQDLVALTRALLHRADRTAWLAILRAPWCGLSLKALAILFEAKSSQTIWQRLNGDLPINLISLAERALLDNFKRVISVALKAVGREPIAPLLERTWLALGGRDAYTELSLSHAERYFELLQSCERNETLITATRLDTLLDRQYVAPPSHAESAVAIMTIHRAKGLEFDVVILPGLGRVPRAEGHRLLAWREHVGAAGRSLLFAPIPRSGSTGDPIHAYLHRAEKQELADEGYRLLYVALTRAREVVHLIGRTKALAEGGPSIPASRSFLRMLWNPLDQGKGFAAVAASEGAAISRVDSLAQRTMRPLIASLVPPKDTPEVSMSVVAMPQIEVEFEWASPIAKHIGTVTHSILQLICRDDWSRRNAQRIHELAPYIDGRLRGLGVAADDRLVAQTTIIAAAVAVVNSERGRWIMDECHHDASSEYALTSVLNGRAINIIIDRTFIDSEGLRWIIDFKTGTHSGGAKDTFIDTEVERYRPQLERYAQLMRRQDPRPIALGLHFPLLDAWREWRYSGND